MRLNHQLFPLFAIVYFFFIVSCNPTGELSQTHTTINSESPIDNSAKDTVEVPINIDTSFSVGQYNTKDKYKIAVLLPFSIDRERLLYFDPDAHERTYQPYIALEFYEGMLMALDSLKKQGANIDSVSYTHLRAHETS